MMRHHLHFEGVGAIGGAHHIPQLQPLIIFITVKVKAGVVPYACQRSWSQQSCPSHFLVIPQPCRFVLPASITFLGDSTTVLICSSRLSCSYHCSHSPTFLNLNGVKSSPVDWVNTSVCNIRPSIFTFQSTCLMQLVDATIMTAISNQQGCW